jgi:hypothetical protein
MRGRWLALVTIAAGITSWTMCGAYRGVDNGVYADGGAGGGSEAGGDDGATGPGSDGGASEGGTNGSSFGNGPKKCDVTMPFGDPVPVDMADDETSIRFTPDLQLGIISGVDNASTNPLYAYEVHRLDDGGLSDRTNVNTTMIHTGAGEGHPDLSADGNTLFFDRDVNGNGNADLYMSIRMGPGIPFVNAKVLTISTANDDRTPFIRADGKVLYFVSGSMPGKIDMTLKDIYRSQLDDAGAFSSAAPVTELNTSVTEDAMIVSDDDLVAYFSSDRSGPTAKGVNIWRATRASTDLPWGAITDVQELNGDLDDRPDYLSRDRCVLYFHRIDHTNAPPTLHRLFVASRSPQ